MEGAAAAAASAPPPPPPPEFVAYPPAGTGFPLELGILGNESAECGDCSASVSLLTLAAAASA